jgi:pyrroloquinoline quinone biosynthesis protein B
MAPMMLQSNQGSPAETPFVVLLGTAQDGGFPHAGCQNDCCARALRDPSLARHVASLAIVDPLSKQRWLLDCTPDFPHQLRLLDGITQREGKTPLNGVLLTHAHVGHYAGLIHLGREVMGTKNIPLYAMARMEEFLKSNGPWDQLVKLENIEIRSIQHGQTIALNSRIKVTPLTVPHRDEYSETVAYRIEGPTRSILWLPDIDKWARWETPIEEVIAKVDRAWVDGTFYDEGEILGRNMSEIPHPFIVESMKRFSKLPQTERNKIHFIHLNHSNPALIEGSPAQQEILKGGFGVGKQGERFSL